MGICYCFLAVIKLLGCWIIRYLKFENSVLDIGYSLENGNSDIEKAQRKIAVKLLSC